MYIWISKVLLTKGSPPEGYTVGTGKGVGATACWVVKTPVANRTIMTITKAISSNETIPRRTKRITFDLKVQLYHYGNFETVFAIYFCFSKFSEILKVTERFTKLWKILELSQVLKIFQKRMGFHTQLWNHSLLNYKPYYWQKGDSPVLLSKEIIIIFPKFDVSSSHRSWAKGFAIRISVMPSPLVHILCPRPWLVTDTRGSRSLLRVVDSRSSRRKAWISVKVVHVYLPESPGSGYRHLIFQKIKDSIHRNQKTGSALAGYSSWMKWTAFDQRDFEHDSINIKERESNRELSECVSISTNRAGHPRGQAFGFQKKWNRK